MKGHEARSGLMVVRNAIRAAFLTHIEAATRLLACGAAALSQISRLAAY
jgi:hypothetical protein